MKKTLLKPLLVGSLSLAMALSASAVAFADEAPAEETQVTTWAQLYEGMGLTALTGQEGYYDAVSSATGIALNNHYTHIPTTIHQVDTGNLILDEEGKPKTNKAGETRNAVELDGVVLTNPSDIIWSMASIRAYILLTSEVMERCTTAVSAFR